jgi:hypothetical protein
MYKVITTDFKVMISDLRIGDRISHRTDKQCILRVIELIDGGFRWEPPTDSTFYGNVLYQDDTWSTCLFEIMNTDFCILERKVPISRNLPGWW